MMSEKIIGYPAGDDGFVPVILCIEGPASRAHDRIKECLTTIGPLADGDLAI